MVITKDRFLYPIFIQIMDFFFLLTTDFLFLNKLPEVSEFAEMKYHLMTSF